MSTSLMTSIVMKSNVTLVDVVSTRMMGQFGFLAKVFKVFSDNKISVDVVATSEVSISLTLDPAKCVLRPGGAGLLLGRRACCDAAPSLTPLSVLCPCCRRIWERDLIAEELEGLMQDFEGVAKAHYRRGMAIISLICNVQRTSQILERTFRVLNRENIRVQMMSQGASKTNIALIVEDSEAKHALRVLHDEFFGSGSS